MIELPCEGLRVFVSATPAEAERAVAREITELLTRAPEAVLGLATGSSPTGVYQELARLVASRRLSFARASSFNLDEYLDLDADHPQSFRRWMREHLFERIDLPRKRARFPVQDARGDSSAAACARFEGELLAAGGVDLQLLGIGRNGHVGFNEPGSARSTRTREVELHPWTREDAARAFGALELVPTRALSMGVETILDARAIRVLAFGERKAEIVRAALEGPIGPECPATYLRGHRDVRVHLDLASAGLLASARAVGLDA